MKQRKQNIQNGSGSSREYYENITAVDIGDVAREILSGRITQETGTSLLCDCPVHKSQSQTSLHVSLASQNWFCFGCGVGGDVLQLVEFVQSGVVTKGMKGPMPESHRQARDFLAQRAGLPPLSGCAGSPDEIARVEAKRASEMRVWEALQATARHYHECLMKNPEALEWLKSKYAISDDTIKTLLIGFSDNATTIKTLLKEFTHRELSASGAFRPTPSDTLDPFFKGRIVFPYWLRGNVVNMIGRKTPWTEKGKFEEAKYKKLPVYNEHRQSHIAQCINNSIFYNEDMFASRPTFGVVTEGVTDCVAGMERGIPITSPVTVRFKKTELKRFVSLAKRARLETVYFCQDNEVSQVGLKGAVETAQFMQEHGLSAKVAILPLGDSQLAARKALEERYDICQSDIEKLTQEKKAMEAKMASLSSEEQQDVKKLLGESKIDLNEYFLAGNTAEDFQKLLDGARTPTELGVCQLADTLMRFKQKRFSELYGTKEDGSFKTPARGEKCQVLIPREMLDIIASVLSEVAKEQPLEQDRLLSFLKEPTEYLVEFRSLKSQVADSKRKHKEEKRQAERNKGRTFDGAPPPPGTCLEAVSEVLDNPGERGPDYKKAAEVAFQWLVDHGAKFYKTSSDAPFMYYDNSIYWMDGSGVNGRKRSYTSLIYTLTREVQTTSGGRTFFDVLSNLAIERGEKKDYLSWLHTDVDQHTLYFNLNNERHEIAKVTPEGVEIVKNGGNRDGIVLDSSPKMLPIEFLPDADDDPEATDFLFSSLITDNLACRVAERQGILLWLQCFLLLDFVGTKPMTRFEGAQGSGKTVASKLITTLIYGSEQQKKATDAANYSDGAKNPLISLDNIEGKQMTDELTSFMLTSITGIAKEKRKSGTDRDTVIERTKCLVNTTGVEPLRGDLAEIQSRTFTFFFGKEFQGEPLLEQEAVALIRKNRDRLMSAILLRTSRILRVMSEGGHNQAMSLFSKHLGSHPKKRCNDYLTLMYLMLFSTSDEESIAQGLQELSPQFEEFIQCMNDTTDEIVEESNEIATLLHALYRRWRVACSIAESPSGYNYDLQREKAHAIQRFGEKYGIILKNGAIVRVKSADIFNILGQVAKECGMRFSYSTARQLAQRMGDELPYIERAGFSIEVTQGRGRTYLYTIRSLEEEGFDADGFVHKDVFLPNETLLRVVEGGK